MWKAPAKKAAGVVAAGVYEIGVTVGSEVAANQHAGTAKSEFPDMKLQEYQAIREARELQLYNRFSLAGNIGTIMSRLFGSDKKTSP